MARGLEASSEIGGEFRWRKWGVVAILALLFHLLLLQLHPLSLTISHPPRVEVQQIDPRKLEAIRKQWDQREKQLLLDKNKNKESEKEAPKDARYMSDRNIRVEKEQRAKQTNVIPKTGRPGENTGETAAEKERPETKAVPKSRPRTRAFPSLGSLGVPLPLPGPAKAEEQERKQQQQAAVQRGHTGHPGDDAGDQALSEKNLPEGSENLLNAQESVYYSFYARIYESIGPIWQSRIRQVPYQRKVQVGEYSSVVDVVLDREGNLVEIRWIERSGIAEFDNAVEHSWHKMGRFPNPPSGLLDKNGQVHTGWTFTVHVGEGFNLDYAAPERNY